MERLFQVVLIGSTLAFSWLAMMVVHEAGHVLHAWISGGQVKRVVLHPLDLSRTDLAHNPHPLFVAWGGAIWGCVLPLVLFALVGFRRGPYGYLFRFFAGFCLIANGAYLGAGSFAGAGDAGDIVRHGAPQWVLILFGLTTMALGLWLWHGLGPQFGLGPSHGQVDRRAAVAVAAALGVLVFLELLTSG
ncbi:MAG: hypothetical protein L0Z62_46825 [Gemmataceae bacterium]|nr:hypothetical protein [Gemmataceae bacterium]